MKMDSSAPDRSSKKSKKRRHRSEPVNVIAANSGNPAKKRKGKKGKANVPTLSESQEAAIQVPPRIVCHNCGRDGHESGDCMADRACLNCKSLHDHPPCCALDQHYLGKQIDHDLRDCLRTKQCSVCRGSDHISVDCPVLHGKHRREYLENLVKPKSGEEKVVVDDKLLLKAKQESQESTARLHDIPAHEEYHEKPKSAKKEKKDKKKRLQESQDKLQNFTAYQERSKKREQKEKNKPKVDKPTETTFPAAASLFDREVPTKDVLDLASINKVSASKPSPTENSQHEDSSQEHSRVADIKPTNFIRRLTSMKNYPIVPPKHSLRLEKGVTDSSPSPTARPKPTPRTARGQIRFTYAPSKAEELMEMEKKQKLSEVGNADAETSSSDSQREEDSDDEEAKSTQIRSKPSPAKVESAKSCKVVIPVRANETSSESESSSDYEPKEDSDDERLEFTSIRNKISSTTEGVRKSPRTITQVKTYDSSSDYESEIEESKAKKPGATLPSIAKKETRILPPSAKKETPIPPPKSLSSRDAIRPASKPASMPTAATPAAKLSTAPLTKKETPIPPPARKTSGVTPPTWIKESLAKTNSVIKASRQNDQAWDGNVLPSLLAGMSRAGGEVKKIGNSQEEKSLRAIPDDWEKTPGRVRGNVGGDDADVQESMY